MFKESKTGFLYDLTTTDHWPDQYWPVGLVLDSPKCNHFCSLDGRRALMLLGWLWAGYGLDISYLLAGYWLAIGWLPIGWLSDSYQLAIGCVLAGCCLAIDIGYLLADHQLAWAAYMYGLAMAIHPLAISELLAGYGVAMDWLWAG